MASLGHVAFGLLVGRAHGGRSRGRNALMMVVLAACALLPDIDVLFVALGVQDGGALGHRGFTHSVLFAVTAGLVSGLIARRCGWAPFPLGFFVFLTVGSHGLLDAMTYTSRGVPFLWPFSSEKFVAPWRPIPAAPTGLEYLTMHGLVVSVIELLYFAPAIVLALWPRKRLGPALSVRGTLGRGAVVAFATISCLALAELVLRDTWIVARLERAVAPEMAVSARPPAFHGSGWR